jgi:hypothetical protein
MSLKRKYFKILYSISREARFFFNTSIYEGFIPRAPAASRPKIATPVGLPSGEAARVWLPLEGHGPPEETKLSRYAQPFLKPCIVIPSKPSFV